MIGEISEVRELDVLRKLIGIPVGAVSNAEVGRLFIFIYTIKGPEDSQNNVAVIFGTYAYT